MKPWHSIVLSVLLTFLVAGLIVLFAGQPRGEAVTLLAPPTPAPLNVQVDGAVKTAGVYVLPPGSRWIDAVEAAGGLADKADRGKVNLAQLLTDGQRVSIPTLPEPTETLAPGIPTPTLPPLDANHPLDLNLASVDDLDRLPGIGPGKAAAIIAYRDAHGPFKTIEELLDVPGIGESIFAQVRALVKVQ